MQLERPGLETRTREPRHQRVRVNETGLEPQRRVGFRTRKHLKGQLAQRPETPQTTDHQLRKIETRRVFNDLAAARNDLAPTVYENYAQKKITHAAVTKPPRPGHSGGDRSAQRRARLGKRRVERQVLTFGAQHFVHHRERRSGERGKGVFLRGVLPDARQVTELEVRPP